MNEFYLLDKQGDAYPVSFDTYLSSLPELQGKDWRAEIRRNKVRYNIGYFGTREEAEAAYRAKADELDSL